MDDFPKDIQLNVDIKASELEKKNRSEKRRDQLPWEDEFKAVAEKSFVL